MKSFTLVTGREPELESELNGPNAESSRYGKNFLQRQKKIFSVGNERRSRQTQVDRTDWEMQRLWHAAGLPRRTHTHTVGMRLYWGLRSRPCMWHGPGKDMRHWEKGEVNFPRHAGRRLRGHMVGAPWKHTEARAMNLGAAVGPGLQGWSPNRSWCHLEICFV